jgi:hypothetical protein
VAEPIHREPPRLVLTERPQLLPLLRRFQGFLTRHPQLGAELLRGLAAEGRRFATTPEGLVWRQRLEASRLVRHGRLLWQSAGLERWIEGEPERLPTEWLQLLQRALEDGDPEDALAALLERER